MTDHLSLILQSDSGIPTTQTFHDEYLYSIHMTKMGDPRYTDLVNKLAIENLPKEMEAYHKNELVRESRYYIRDEPYLWKQYLDQVIRRSVPEEEQRSIIEHCHSKCDNQPIN